MIEWVDALPDTRRVFVRGRELERLGFFVFLAKALSNIDPNPRNIHIVRSTLCAARGLDSVSAFPFSPPATPKKHNGPSDHDRRAKAGW